MYSRRDDTVLPVPGFPIRKSSDQSLLSGSPRLIAASHVLHRRLAPRHPPCALSSLTIIDKAESAKLTALSSELPLRLRYYSTLELLELRGSSNAGYPDAIVKELRID